MQYEYIITTYTKLLVFKLYPELAMELMPYSYHWRLLSLMGLVRGDQDWDRFACLSEKRVSSAPDTINLVSCWDFLFGFCCCFLLLLLFLVLSCQSPLCIQQDVLPVWSWSCLSCFWPGNFLLLGCLLHTSFFALLVVTLLTYLGKIIQPKYIL